MKTAVQETSLSAYADIKPELPDRQRQVFDCIRNHDTPMTNTEISNITGIPINAVVPRVFELRQLGMITFAGKRPCGITGKLCMTWKPAGEQGELPI